MHKFVIVEGCNFEDFPAGGQLTFVRQLMEAYGNRVALVGISTDGTPVGKWLKKTIDGIEYDFFAYQKRAVTSKKPLVPARLSGLIGLHKHRVAITSAGYRNYFVQSHESLPMVLRWPRQSICFCFPGVANPIMISRYKWAKLFARGFDAWFLRAAADVDVLLAAADVVAIGELKKRGGGILTRRQISSFPTRISTEIFHPGNKEVSRGRLNIRNTGTLIVTTGRLHWAKGWVFLLTAFSQYLKIDPSASFVFVGDGEDRDSLVRKAQELGIDENIIITGHVQPHTVAEYLRAADLFVLGSVSEGWSTSLVEALAASRPIVTTNVSSANELVKDGVNGYVVVERNSKDFAEAIGHALALEEFRIREFSEIEIKKYSVGRLEADFNMLWPAA